MSTTTFKIKVCGMRDPGNISQLLALKPEFYSPAQSALLGITMN
jgi:hypothetical protein